MTKIHAMQVALKEIDDAFECFVGNAAACDDLTTDQWLECHFFKDDIMREINEFFAKLKSDNQEKKIDTICPECETIGHHNHEQRGI